MSDAPIPKSKRTVDVGALYNCLESKREGDGLSWREVARELDVNHSVFTRLSQGKRPDVDTFMTLTGWLGLAAERFVTGPEPQAPDEVTVEVIAKYLRADRALKPKSREAVERIMRAAYDGLST